MFQCYIFKEKFIFLCKIIFNRFIYIEELNDFYFAYVRTWFSKKKKKKKREGSNEKFLDLMK